MVISESNLLERLNLAEEQIHCVSLLRSSGLNLDGPLNSDP